MGEILQHPLRVKGQHRRVKSNAADNTAAVVGLGQMNQQSQYKVLPGQQYTKNGSVAKASNNPRGYDPWDATYAHKEAGEGMIRNMGPQNVTSKVLQGYSGQTSVKGSQDDLGLASQ